jgi:hypothetical protein
MHWEKNKTGTASKMLEAQTTTNEAECTHFSFSSSLRHQLNM